MNFSTNGLAWTIEYADANSNVLHADDGIIFGLTEYKDLKIYIRPGMSRELTERTVLHELMHCFIFSHGIDGSGTFCEEHVCNMFGAYAKEAMKICNAFLKSKKITEIGIA